MEVSFRGSHSDGGGSYRTFPEASYLTLNWMRDQGNLAANGELFRPSPKDIQTFVDSEQGRSGKVFIHDSRIDEDTGSVQWIYYSDWRKNMGERKILIPLKNPYPFDPTLRAGGCLFRGRFVFFFITLHAGRLGDGLTRWTDSTFLSAKDH
jgi:hypothetical protein